MNRRRRFAVPPLLLASTALALSACSDDGTGLASRLLDTVPDYTLSASNSGALDTTGAAKSLPTDPTTTTQALTTAHFNAGYSRIFLRDNGAEYVLLAIYAMDSANGATSFVAAERSALEGTGTVQLFSDDAVPNSTGFVLTGPTKRGTRYVFCDGIVFPHASDVYAVTTCSTMPTDASLATQLARQQAQRAAQH